MGKSITFATPMREWPRVSLESRLHGGRSSVVEPQIVVLVVVGSNPIVHPQEFPLSYLYGRGFLFSSLGPIPPRLPKAISTLSQRFALQIGVVKRYTRKPNETRIAVDSIGMVLK